MDMRLQYIGNLDALSSGKVQIGINVPLRIDYGDLSGPRTSHGIRIMSQTGNFKTFK